MPILSDAAIVEALEAGDLGIEPFVEKHLTPNGVDLRIGEALLPETGETVTNGTVTVPPGTRFLLATEEVVTFGPQLVGQLWIRSSYARRGVLASFGKVEAGFSGQLTIGCFNASHEPLEIPIGDRFCQICIEALDRPAAQVYEQRSGTYQHSRGVTIAK